MATVRVSSQKGSKTALAYVRYSTEKQGINSIGRQLEAIESWAMRTGVRLLGVFFDFELSRTLDCGQRPGLMAAIEATKEQGVDVLVVESISRLGDNLILETLRRMMPKGSRLTTSSETGNAELDEDREDLEAFFSKREIKQIRQRTKGALAAKRLRGEALGTLPWGFRRKADGQHVVDRYTKLPKCAAGCSGCLNLEPDECEQGIVTRAKTLSDPAPGHPKGLSLRKIADKLYEEGARARTGNKISYEQVRRFLYPLLVACAAAGVAA